MVGAFQDRIKFYLIGVQEGRRIKSKKGSVWERSDHTG